MKAFNVYINGTNEQYIKPGEGRLSLASLLHTLTIQDDDNQSTCVDGCSIDNHDPRDLGAIFTFKLEKQVDELVKEIKALLKNTKDSVTVNAFGFSRGGVGVFLLAQKLKNVAPNRLKINLLSFEPVPGNLITSVYADMLSGIKYSISNATYDLSDCTNIENMKVLFTNQPLPDISGHAPLLPIAPKTCNYSMDIVPGCHIGAEQYYLNQGEIKPANEQSSIAFHQAIVFLQKIGVHFNFKQHVLNKSLVYLDNDLTTFLPSKDNVLTLYRDMVQSAPIDPYGTQSILAPSKRSMHMHNLITTEGYENKSRLNYYHQKLEGDADAKQSERILSIKTPTPTKPSIAFRSASALVQAALLVGIYARIMKHAPITKSASGVSFNVLSIILGLVALRILTKGISDAISSVSSKLIKSKEDQKQKLKGIKII